MTLPAEAWDRIKPFAMQDLGPLLDTGGTGASGAPILILLYDISAGDIEEYSYSDAGLIAAIAASASGDTIYVPTGTITGGPWTNKSGVTLFGEGETTVLTGTLTNNGTLVSVKVIGNVTNASIVDGCVLTNQGGSGDVLTQTAGLTIRTRVDNYINATWGVYCTGGGLNTVVVSISGGTTTKGCYYNASGTGNEYIFWCRLGGSALGMQLENAIAMIGCQTYSAAGGTSFKHTTGTAKVSNCQFTGDAGLTWGVDLSAAGITFTDCSWDSINGIANVTYGQGDRGAYNVENYHATDIEGGTLLRHLPAPTSSSGDAGKYPKLNAAGTAWELSTSAPSGSADSGPFTDGDPYSSLVAENGYADDRVNPTSYRYDAIASVDLAGTVYQAVSFWNADGYMVLGKRVLDGAWTLYTYDGSGGLPTISVTPGDNHHVISIGLDPDGFLHAAYNMHGDPLLYRKSSAAIDSWTGGLGAAGSMTGSDDDTVTYPTFLNDPSGSLYFLYRNETTTTNGELYFLKYTHGTTTWAAVTGSGTGGVIIQGTGTALGDRYPYFNHPVFDDDFGSGGFFHISWHWRDDYSDGNTNNNIGYMRWDGTNWTKSTAAAQTIPATLANQETIADISTGNGLTSFNSMYSDSSDHPHVVFVKTGDDGFRHIYHMYHTGSSWSTARQLTFSLAPEETDQTSNAYLVPVIVIDRTTDRVFIFYTDDYDTPGVLAMVSGAGDYTTWKRIAVYPRFAGWYQPKLDYAEWENSQTAYLLVEFWLDGETSLPIRLVKWDPSADWQLTHDHFPESVQNLPTNGYWEPAVVAAGSDLLYTSGGDVAMVWIP